MPNSLPKTIWACKTVVNDYSWQNRNATDVIEISISSSSERTVFIGGKPPITVRGKALSCLVGDLDVKSSAETGVSVEIISVAVRIEGLCAVAKEFDEEDFCADGILLVPYRVDNISEKELSDFENLMHKYIHSYVEASAASKLLCCSVFLDLLCRLDAIARRSVHAKKDKYLNYYVMKTDALIKSSYFEKISLQSIADELGITPSYLSYIYKLSNGIGFSQRLFETRAQKVKELLVSSSLSVAEIAHASGFGDESNLRKQFKRHFGISIREYRSIAKEQTLYHKKPTRENQNS